MTYVEAMEKIREKESFYKERKFLKNVDIVDFYKKDESIVTFEVGINSDPERLFLHVSEDEIQNDLAYALFDYRLAKYYKHWSSLELVKAGVIV